MQAAMFLRNSTVTYGEGLEKYLAELESAKVVELPLNGTLDIQTEQLTNLKVDQPIAFVFDYNNGGSFVGANRIIALCTNVTDTFSESDPAIFIYFAYRVDGAWRLSPVAPRVSFKNTSMQGIKYKLAKCFQHHDENLSKLWGRDHAPRANFNVEMLTVLEALQAHNEGKI